MIAILQVVSISAQRSPSTHGPQSPSPDRPQGWDNTHLPAWPTEILRLPKKKIEEETKKHSKNWCWKFKKCYPSIMRTSCAIMFYPHFEWLVYSQNLSQSVFGHGNGSKLANETQLAHNIYIYIYSFLNSQLSPTHKNPTFLRALAQTWRQSVALLLVLS